MQTRKGRFHSKGAKKHSESKSKLENGYQKTPVRNKEQNPNLKKSREVRTNYTIKKNDQEAKTKQIK